MTSDQLNITPVPARQLSDEQVRRWSALQAADSMWQSPYFRPEFTLAVATVCPNVEVAVFERDGEPVGFFPYQRVNGKHAEPVGGMMSDYQGVVLAPGTTFSPRALLQACELVSWKFDHLLADQTEFCEFHGVQSESLYLDLSSGYEAYLSERRKAGKKPFFKKLAQRSRRLELEVGPLRLECSMSDLQVLRTVIDWKSQQYRRSKVTDIFHLSWPRPLLEEILRIRTPQFAGMLCALYAGDRLVAADFAMRSGRVLHSWIGTYDPTFPARYSAGHLLLLETAKAAQSLGIDHIDLGKGVEPYKQSWMSGTVPLTEGVVDLRTMPKLLKTSWIRARERIRATSVGYASQKIKRMVHPFFESRTIRSHTTQTTATTDQP